MRLWSWYTIHRQRTEQGNPPRLVTDDDDLTGIIEMLHELHGDDGLRSPTSDAAIARCSKPSPQCRKNLVAYQTSLGSGWVCTAPPINAMQVPPDCDYRTVETEYGDIITTCARCTLGRWKNAPQHSRDVHKIPNVRHNRNRQKRVIAAWIRAACKEAIGGEHHEAAMWVLGRFTNRQLTYGDPSHSEVEALALHLQRMARADRAKIGC